MKKTLFTALALVLMAGAAVVFPLTAAHAVETFAIETELRIYDPTKSYGGYFLFQPYGNTSSLLDMEGYVVKEWIGTNSNPRLLENGNLWTVGQLMDWDGSILWSFNAKTDPTPVRTDINVHHDGLRIWNKKLKAYTYLLLYNRTVTNAEIWAAGGDPAIDYAAKGRNTQIDGIIEVNQNKQIIWEWNFMDHTCQSKNPAWPNYVSDVKLAPGKCDVFYLTNQEAPSGTAGIVADWQHVNSIDYNEDLDVVAANAKYWSTFYVVDHGKTFVSTTDWAANKAAAKGPAGDFIYRFGNPAAYNQGKAPAFQDEGDQQIFGAHNIHWIRAYHWERPHAEAGDKWPDPLGYTKSGVALPGVGNFLIFDNGCYNPTGYHSRIREINPFLNAAGVNTGWFVNPPDAGYYPIVRLTKQNALPQGPDHSGDRKTNKQVVWTYKSLMENSFYSSHISGMQRLPNGNTSIMAGNQGHMFEVTPSGEVVWEYIKPTNSKTSATVLRDADGRNNGVFRHYRYGKEFPGLTDKDLTRKGTITGRIPRTVGSDFTYPQPVTYYGFGMGPSGTTVGGGGGAGSSGSGAGGGAGGGGY